MKTKTSYTRVSKGVYKTNSTYRVRKTVNGVLVSRYFTNKTNAIKFYKSL